LGAWDGRNESGGRQAEAVPDGPGGEEGVRPRAELHELHRGQGLRRKSSALVAWGGSWAGRDPMPISCRRWTDREASYGYGWGGTGQDPNARMGLLGTARNGSKITARGDTGLVARRRRPASQGTVLTGARMLGILIGDSGRSAGRGTSPGTSTSSARWPAHAVTRLVAASCTCF